MFSGVAVALHAALVSLYIGDEPLDRDPLLFVRTMTTAFVGLAALSFTALAVSIKSGVASTGATPRSCNSDIHKNCG